MVTGCTQEKNVTMLNQAFEAFSQTTVQFQKAYTKLEERIAYLSEELAQKNEELKHNITELERTRHYINNVLESISDGVIALDLSGTITTINRSAQHITGFQADEIIARPYDDVFVRLNKGSDFIATVTQGALPINGIETVVKNNAGDEVPIIAFASLLANECSEIIGVVITFNDLRKIKQLEGEIERAKRLAALGEMAAGVAHEIRNPLGGIEMFVSLLHREFTADERNRTITESILKGIKSINRIIAELLNFTRSFNTTRFERIDVISCIEASLTYAAHEVAARAIRIERSYTPTDTFYITGDQDQVQQVFLNLLLNAAQAIDHTHGLIAIRVVPQHERSCLSVEIADNGCGIPADTREKIFNPFFTTKPKGTGLGLAISYRIIEAHQGTLSVKSRQDEGTVFTVVLPFTQER